MKLTKKFFINIGLAFLISSIVVLLSWLGLLNRLEAAGSDFLFRLRGFSSYNPRIVIVEITDENLSEIGRWPWDREWHAAMTKVLKDLGARQIYFDIIFSEPSNEKSDNLFSQAIEETKITYLPFAFQEKEADPEKALYPIDELNAHIKGTGSINVYPDRDGSIRKLPLFFKVKGAVIPHITLTLVTDYTGTKIEKIHPDKLILSGEGKRFVIPIKDGNKMPINWLGRWKDTFTHYNFMDILTNYKAFVMGEKTSVDLRPIKGSICFVAVTAIGLYDIRPTPLEGEYPGVGAIATAISTILDNKLLTPAPLWLNLALIYILALVPLLFITGEKLLREILGVVLTGAFFLGIVIVLFFNSFVVNYTLPLISLIASYTAIGTFHFARVSLERKQFFQMAVTDGLTQLANIRYFMMILNTEFMLAKRERGKTFCVIMTDIDHFKNFNDTWGHATGDLILKEVAKILKDSVRGSDLVARYGGEEMIILLRATSLENAMFVAEKIRKNVEEHRFKDSKHEYKVAISLGVSQFRSESDNMETLIKRADSGLYKAKESGRNRVETLEERG